MQQSQQFPPRVTIREQRGGYTVTVCEGRGSMFNRRVFVTTRAEAERCKAAFKRGESPELRHLHSVS